METKILKNNYVHHESVIKNKCRTAILANIMKMFPNAETLNTFTLGGEHLMTEKMLAKYYNLNGVSYEFNKDTAKNAKLNAPKGINIIEGNIFNHKYKGTEQFIWFDFMTALRPNNISDLLGWITNNPIKNDCVFAATYTLHSRNEKGYGRRQLFANDDEHNEFINEVAQIIAMYLGNEFVEVNPNISIIQYRNTDISKSSLPMVQFIFNLVKK